MKASLVACVLLFLSCALEQALGASVVGATNCYSLACTSETTMLDPSSITTETIGTVYAGGSFACLLNPDGTKQLCFGDNSYGQQDLPATGVGYTFIGMSAGSDFSCVVDSLNGMTCQGDNTHNQTGAVVNAAYEQVAASHNTVCGREISTGNVYCWGEDNNGQASPTAGGFSDISLGPNFGCGIQGGSIICWGTASTALGAIPPDTNFVTLAKGLSADAGCALTDAGDVICWGDPAYGGDASGLTDGSWSQLCMGDDYACTVDSADNIQCWGDAPPGWNNLRTTNIQPHIQSLSCGQGDVCLLSYGDCPSPSFSPSRSASISSSPSRSMSNSRSASRSASVSRSSSPTPSFSASPSESRSPDPTPSLSPSVSMSGSVSRTATPTPTVSASPSPSSSPSSSRSPSASTSASMSPSRSSSISASMSKSVSSSRSVTPSISESRSPSGSRSPSASMSSSRTSSPSVSSSRSPSISPSNSKSLSATPTPAKTAAASPSLSPSFSSSRSTSRSSSPSRSQPISPSESRSQSSSRSPSASVSESMSESNTPLPSLSPSPSSSPSASPSPSATPSPSSPGTPSNTSSGDETILYNLAESQDSIAYSVPTVAVNFTLPSQGQIWSMGAYVARKGSSSFTLSVKIMNDDPVTRLPGSVPYFSESFVLNTVTGGVATLVQKVYATPRLTLNATTYWILWNIIGQKSSTSNAGVVYTSSSTYSGLATRGMTFTRDTSNTATWVSENTYTPIIAF